MTIKLRATWTDTDGNTYEQGMELADGDTAEDLRHHEEWVRENHNVKTYSVGHVGHWSTFGTYWCDTCNSPLCDLA